MRALALVLALAGCDPPTLVWALDARMSDEQRGAFAGAMQDWNDLGCDFRLATRVEDIEGFVALEVPANGDDGNFNDGENLMRLRPGLPLPRFRATARHELGHALNLEHTAAGVMQERISSDTFSPEDHAERRRVGACQ